MSDWDNASSKRLLDYLFHNEYIYNREHKDYKTYVIIKKCAEFGDSLRPPRTGKEVLDKITSFRKDVASAKQIIENLNDKYSIDEIEKLKDILLEYGFMFTALYGIDSQSILTKLQELCTHKRSGSLSTGYPSPKKLKLDLKEDTKYLYNEMKKSVTNFENQDSFMIHENQTLGDYLKNEQNHSAHDSFETNIYDVDAEDHDSEQENNSFFSDDFTQFNMEKEQSSEEDEDLIDPYKILYIECTDEIASEDEVVALKMINFIREKINFNNIGSYANEMSREELEVFGKTFIPPLPGDRVLEIITQMLEKFKNSVGKPPDERWCWFEHCKFLLDSSQENCNELKPKLTDKTIRMNIEKLQKTRAEDPKLLLEVISFVEDNPCFYNCNDVDYFNVVKKEEMRSKFKLALKNDYDLSDVSKMLEFIEKRVRKQILKDYPEMENIENEALDHTANIIESFQTKKPVQNFSKSRYDSKSYNVAAIQCNLYEELRNQNNNRECNCPSDCIQSVGQNESSVSEDQIEKFALDENDKWNEKLLEDENEESRIGNYLYQHYFPDFSDYSSDDGLTELPLPEYQPKSRAKLPNGKFQCEDCDEEFDNGMQLYAHERAHGEKALVCYKCGKVNKYYRKLRMHENNCNPEANKNCYECKLTFKNHLNYHDHNNQYHDKSNPYVCCCRQAFTSYNKLITHLNRSDCGSIEDCTIPEYVSKDFMKTFIEQRYKNEDEFVKTCEKTKFWCKICNRNYVRNDVYMKHFTRQFHLKAEKKWMNQYKMHNIFACDFCNKDDEPTIFKTLYELVTHRHGTHHKCSLVQFFEELETIAEQGPVELAYDVSMVTLTCRICKEKYGMKNFMAHFESVEHRKCEKTWIIDNNLRNFCCNVCCSSFKTMIQYLEHMHEAHMQWPTNRLLKLLEGIDIECHGKKYYKFYCSICDYKTNNKRYYSSHVLTHGSHFKCSCGQRFKVLDKLVLHRSSTNCDPNGCIEFSSKVVLEKF